MYPSVSSSQHQYSEEKRQEAAVLYRYTGNTSVVAHQTGIARATLVAWQKTDWWKQLQEDLIAQSRAELSGNLKKLVDKAQQEVEDRLSNGDWVFDQKAGQMVRKPVNADVANRILQDSIRGTLEVQKLQSKEERKESEEKAADRLLRLAREFAKFANSKTIEGKFHAIHDQREEGLQEGIEVGPLQT